jgi:hypothetical protein
VASTIEPSRRVALGYALPESAASLSDAAALARSASLTANPSSHQLPISPRSVLDQLDLNCCVSCAITSAMESRDASVPPLAPLFHYHVCRFDDGGADADGSLFLDKALASLSRKGICRTELHPYPFTEAGTRAIPSTAAQADAASRALRTRPPRFPYSRARGLSRVTWAREELQKDHPLLLGMRLPETYPDRFLNARFEWLEPDASAMTLAGHCVVVTGFSDLRQAVRVQDSRASKRFDGGRWWMGYRVLDSPAVLELYSLTA